MKQQIPVVIFSVVDQKITILFWSVAAMKFMCDSKYIILPVSHTAQKKRLKFFHSGQLLFDLEIELDFVNPDFDAYIHVERFAGMELDMVCVPEINMAVGKSNVKYAGEEIYGEKHRPRFHFAAKRGWLNDPNGLVYYHGQYHMFYQHNPVGCKWGNMHWGHAVSSDLVHWSELECALHPDPMGTMFSGSAIIDKKNVTGLKATDEDVIVLYYTAAGSTSEISKDRTFTQCMAYSVDGGKTFKKYDKNPILPNIAEGNRDPKVIFHELSNQYIMALYLNGNQFALLSSKNLIDWKKIQELTLSEDAECPDFYPLALDGDSNNIKWVFTGASDRYVIGRFDGNRFTPETEVKKLHYGKNSYASQTWSGIQPYDGRCIRTTWNTYSIPFMPFNQCMTFPCEMTLHTTADGISLCAYPIQEIEHLYIKTYDFTKIHISENETYKIDLYGKSYDIQLKISPAGKANVRLSLFGIQINIDAPQNQIRCLDSAAPLFAHNGMIDLRMLVDTTSIEVYINKGQALIFNGCIADYNISKFEIEAMGCAMIVEDLKMAELKSVWQAHSGNDALL